MPDLPDWLAFAPQLDAVYQQELGRSAFSDPEAFVNWTFHWREGRQSLDWIRQQVRSSPEWVQRQAQPPQETPAPPAPSPEPTPLPRPAPGLPGGTVELATSVRIRPRLSASELSRLVPSQRGPFSLPAPYGRRCIRLTDDRDGTILRGGYSYWPQLNNHAREAVLLACVGRASGEPLFLMVDKASGQVRPFGAPLVPYRGTTEGWYWSQAQESTLFVAEGPRLRRVQVIDGSETVALDISAQFPGCRLWQCHSSADDRVHSGTVQRIVAEGPYENLGGVVGAGTDFRFLPAQGVYDECAVDAGGRWLVIKETHERGGRDRLDNRVVDLGTGAIRTIRDEDGALGHSDLGDGVMIGENDVHPTPGALCSIDLATGLSTLDYHGVDWVDSTGRGLGMGHVSVRGQRALLSHASHEDLARSNELVLVPLDGSRRGLLVAPNLSSPDGADDYDNQPFASLDAGDGTWAFFTANGHGRRDAFAVEIG